MKQKVLIIGPCLSMGGIERASANTANGLEASGKVTVVFVSLFKKDQFFALNNEVSLLEPNGFNSKKLSLAKSIRWLRNVVKDEKPDRVLVFNKFYAAITGLALIDSKVPLFISERSSPLYVWKQPFKIIIQLAFFLKPPRGVLAQTSVAASYQKKYFARSKVEVIPNILRSIKLHPEIERTNTILAVGRLGDHLKGFDLLIESFSLLNNKSWELHIAGGDENGEDLKKLAASLGILDRIKFLGKVKDIDIVYASAGIFVIPSRSEGFPNALAEAMGAGCCCVSFNFTAGPSDMINQDISGILVENGDVKMMAKKLDDLINQPKVRDELGKQAIKIVEKLDSSVISNKIIKFLELN